MHPMHFNDVRNVFCPRCAAAVGHRCTELSGSFTMTSHLARIDMNKKRLDVIHRARNFKVYPTYTRPFNKDAKYRRENGSQAKMYCSSIDELLSYIQTD